MKKILKISIIFIISLAIISAAIFIPQYVNKVGVFKEKEIKFTVFSDLHYRTDMYPATVKDLETILNRAKKTESDFVIQCGDFCLEYSYAQGFLNEFLNNKQNLPVYSVYGNHELEKDGRMEHITANFTNDENVVWGTKNGKLAKDGKIGYYYFEKNGFRMICVDTNYYYSHGYEDWRHNEDDSYGPPNGVELYNGLGPVQLEWLENVLMDAAKKKIPCIVYSHTTFCPSWRSDSCDADKVREIFRKVNEERPKTILMALNGHYHSYNVAQVEDIVYLSVPAAINMYASSRPEYTDEHIYDFYKYDSLGYLEGVYDMKIKDIMGNEGWYAEDPLNAVVTVKENGDIEIEGIETGWMFDYAPEGRGNPVFPSSSFTLEEE